MADIASTAARASGRCTPEDENPADIPEGYDERVGLTRPTGRGGARG